MVSFAGFPLGGFAAMILTGRVDSAASALLGGLVTGAVLGAVQGWALGVGVPRPRVLSWTVATATGLMTGLAVGATLVDFRTALGDLVLQGAVCGAAIGLLQAVTLWPQLHARALVWPPFLAIAWALGWAVTTSIGVRVDEQFTVFGSAGAVVVTALTAVLPLALHHLHTERTPS
jgi:hypothetical protein